MFDEGRSLLEASAASSKGEVGFSDIVEAEHRVEVLRKIEGVTLHESKNEESVVLGSG